jgi:hypothetical protein
VSDNLDPCVSQSARKRQQNNENHANLSFPSNILGSKGFDPIVNSQITPDQKTKKKSSSRDSLYNEAAKVVPYKEKLTFNTSVDDQSIHLSSLPSMSPYERYGT